MKYNFSLKKELYLNDHRFKGTPYLPFVMTLATLLRECGNSLAQFYVENFEISHPIFFRKDRDKEVEIIFNKESDETLLISMTDLEGEVLNSGRLVLTKAMPVLEKFLPTAIIKSYSAKELYPAIIPHGEHFQMNFSLMKHTDTESVGRLELLQPHVRFIEGVEHSALPYHPGLLDALLQLCALRVIEKDQRYILPVKIEGLSIDREEFLKQTSLYFQIKDLGSNTFSIVAFGEIFQPIVLIERMYFEALHQKWIPFGGLKS